MKTIHVGTSKKYEVHVGSGLLSRLGEYAATVTRASRICIISDSNVWPLYGSQVSKTLTDSGYILVPAYIFPAGEESKNGNTYLSILDHLASHQLTRSDCIIALGGGVVGDMAGFAAATFLRGIDYIQIPTTLLAAVDSSVGGKTAIDLPSGKNLAGAFYQPKLVLCDTDTLNTLPEDIFRDGCAEVIKYAVLFDPALFSLLERDRLSFDRESVIARCVEWKNTVVSQDEFDTGERMKLNLGHTFGHGVEALSRFSISHGSAVAIGTAIICRACTQYGICTSDTADRIVSLLKAFGLPVHTEASAQTLFRFAMSDKKCSGKTVSLILPEKVGSCIIRPTPIEEIESFIQAGL